MPERLSLVQITLRINATREHILLHVNHDEAKHSKRQLIKISLPFDPGCREEEENSDNRTGFLVGYELTFCAHRMYAIKVQSMMSCTTCSTCEKEAPFCKVI